MTEIVLGTAVSLLMLGVSVLGAAGALEKFLDGDPRTGWFDVGVCVIMAFFAWATARDVRRCKAGQNNRR